MTHLLVASTLSGLLAALDTALQGRKGLATLTEGADIQQRLADPKRPIDVLILDDTITPLADKPTIEDTLWYLMYWPTRTLLVFHEESFPPQIRDPLIGSARESGGDAYRLPLHSGPREAAQAVQWITSHLDLGQSRQQAWIMPLSGAGGVGKSTQMANLAIALRRRGYRILIIDADFANGSLSGFFKIAPGTTDTFLTLSEEFPKPMAAYPVESIQRQIYAHPCGIDLLLSGRGVIEVEDLTAKAMHALLTTVRQLPYDVVCLDAGPDIKARPYAIDVLRAGGTGLIVCPPGRKERRGAENILTLMRQMTAPGRNTSLLAQAAILFVEAEHGSVANIDEVRRDLVRQYPDATNLGVMPRDARVISMVAERDGFCTIYDIDPRGRYCQALETACDRLMTHMRLPAPTYAQNGHAQLDRTSQHASQRGGIFSFLGIRRAADSHVVREERTSWN
jgi:MinD-like ATPase involved in chromosome partitioning or flagellar assembly